MRLSAITLLSTLLTLGCTVSQQAMAQGATSASEASSGTATPAAQSRLSETGRDPAQFPAYVEQLKRQALAQGISPAIVDSAFTDVHFVDRVIKADRNQPEKKITLDDYLKRVLPPAKIAQGRALYQQYHPKLSRLTAHYGVPGRYVVALWGMESAFGKIQGREDVISALATLAFEGRREAFFSQQLMAALQILEQGHVSREQLKGSWGNANLCRHRSLTMLRTATVTAALISGTTLTMSLPLRPAICRAKAGSVVWVGAERSGCLPGSAPRLWG